MLESLNEGVSLPNYNGQPLVIGLGAGIAEFATDSFTASWVSDSSHPYGSRGNLPSTWGGSDPRWSFSDTITWTRGAHSFKGGFDMRFANSWQDSNGAAGFIDSTNTFPSVKGGVLTTSQYSATGTFKPQGSELPNWAGMTGSDLGMNASGNFTGAYNLLNYVTGSIGKVGQYFYVNSKSATSWNDPSSGELKQVVDLSNREFSFFFKDDWKISSSLTLNLGMRWEYYGIPYSGTGMTAALKGGSSSLWRGGTGFQTWLTSLTAPTSAPALSSDLAQYEFVGPNSPNPDKSLWNKDSNNFAPHVGFAWQLPWFGKGKTTLRGGYSISYSPLNNFDGYAGMIAKVPGANYSLNFTGGGSAPAYVDLMNLGSVVPLVPDASIKPLAARPDNNRTDGITVYDQNVRNPYVQSLNLSVTRNVGNNLTVDVRYIATLSRKAISGINLNTPNIYANGLFDALNTVRNGGTSALLDALIPNGAYGPGTGSSQVRNNLPMFTSIDMANGNFVGVANELATGNGVLSVAPSVKGAVLRSGCLPSQLVPGDGEGEGESVCNGHTPENFIYTNPQFSAATIQSNLSHANYHSMQAQVTMRPTRGLSFQTSYTWSRNLADRGITDYRQGAARDYYLSDQHRSHQLTSYGTFDMPFGANGFIFRNATGVFKKAIEGWQLSWIASMTSGVPGSISGASRLWGASNVDLVRPDLWDNKAGKVTWQNKANQGYFYGDKVYVTGTDPQCAATGLFWCSYKGFGLNALGLDTNGNKQYDAGIDTIIFQNAAPGTRGNYGLNTVSGPGRWSLDMAMGKSIEFMEGKKIDFRIDAQNIFNHATPSNSSTQWNARFTSIGNPNFALNSGSEFGVLGTKGGHRTFQAKIRISF